MTNRNAVTDDQPSADREPGGHRAEPKSYVAPDKRNSSLAGPAAGEMSDYADEGHASGGARQGGDHTNREFLERQRSHQGKQTRDRQKEIIQQGLPPER